MKKILLFLWLLSACSFLRAQTQNIQNPLLRTKELHETEIPVQLSEARISVRVIGSLAETTLDLTFYNPNKRVLEGELNFPLGDGQAVSRFALDINGKLREGVVVEKSRGQAVFESIVREEVDPGLLEKTQGNNFRTKMYPIPAEGYRRVVIAYEEELVRSGTHHPFFLPVAWQDTLERFMLDITVFGTPDPPVVREFSWGTFSFDQSGNAWKASYEKKDFPAFGQLAFSIPVKQHNTVQLEEGKIDNKLFFHTRIFPDLPVLKREKPDHISIFWDASGSMEGCRSDLNADFLEHYLASLGNTTVDLYFFNCFTTHAGQYRIRQGNWDELKKAITQVSYDGATQFGILDFSRLRTDHILLFSDGLSNLLQTLPKTGSAPVSIINSSLSADHRLLKYITIQTGGNYVDLTRQTPQQATALMKNTPVRLMVADYKRGHIEELVVSGTPGNNQQGVSVCGKLLKKKTTLTLKWGDGKKVHATQTIRLDKNKKGDYNGFVEKIWAGKRIDELDMRYDSFKEEIQTLGKTYRIVTRSTSLIVLEEVEDYVRHRISPPDELLETYRSLVSKEEEEASEQQKERLDEVYELFEERKEWWNKRFPKETQPMIRKETSSRSTETDRPAGEVFAPGRDTTYTLHEYFREIRQSGEVNDNISGVFRDGEEKPISDVASPLRIQGFPLYIVDGILYEKIQDIPVEQIESVNILTIASAVSLYGSRANNGVVVISTHDAPDETEDSSPGLIAGMALKRWQPDMPYMEILNTTPKDKLYAAYLSLKGEYRSLPAFYLDVSALLKSKDMHDEALVVLSNLAEIGMEQYRLLRVLAYRLKDWGYHDYAVGLFKNVLQLRPEEPQSYRDLGLAYAACGDYQQAIDILYTIVEREWDDRFEGIELFALEEINHAIQKAKKEKVKLDLKRIDKRFIYLMPLDIRMVLNWDTDNSDMDLWVTDPYGETCDYNNPLTRIGGLLTEDLMEGYGPEAFLLRKAHKGKYRIEADYYGSNEQSIIGPSTLYLDIYTHYSTSKERKETIILRISKDEEKIYIGEIEFKP